MMAAERLPIFRSNRPALGLRGQRLPELNLIPIHVIDPGKPAIRFIHPLVVNLDTLLLQAVEREASISSTMPLIMNGAGL